MNMHRRTFVGGMAATLVTPWHASAASITDATGRTVTAPDRVARIYPAGPPAAIWIYTLAPDLLIGWVEALTPEQREFLLPDVAAQPTVARLTGRSAETNLDAVTALKPDLIVDIGTVNASYTSLAERVQQQTGIPYVLLDGILDRVGATYRALGHMIGRSEAAEKLARYAETTIATITQRSTAVPPGARPRVYYARDAGGLQTARAGSMIGQPIDFLGAHNVAAELPSGGSSTVSIEQVASWNPDVIIASDRDFATRVRNDQAWASIAAVKAGRVYLAPRLPFGWVDYPPAVNRLIGLWWLAKIFYPAQFPEDIKALTRDFYTAFYHVTPSAAQIERVFAAAG